MVESFLAWWMAHVPVSPKLSVFLVSMIPLIEERGGLILARMLGIPMWEAVFWCVLGNIVPIPFILLLIKKVIHWMADHHLSGVAEWLIRKAEKNKPKIDRYGFLGLMLFVGIPLPGTGAWTGSLVAALFDMDLKKASISILLGIFLAAVIMTVFSYGLLGNLIS
ncbi:MAG: small multi-drug export protein [Erysipelotrichaceae bacterium]|nr:small multi-drug export protein [Erysipelotrichaceae bacterium]